MKYTLPKSLLYQTLEKKVGAYFIENKISKTGDWRLYIKTIFWLFVLISSYLALFLFPYLPLIMQIALCAVHGFTWACIGFNVVHDAAHNSYSSNKTLNNVLSYLFDLMGASHIFWKAKHNIAHHTFANVMGADDDIDTMGFLRLSPNQKWRWYHRIQAYYAPFLYSTLYVIWVFVKDPQKFITRKVAGTQIRMKEADIWLFFIFKALYMIIYIVIPIMFFGWTALYGYFIAACICGITLSIVFQLAHIVPKAQFPVPNGDELESDFAIHQAATTVDFAPKNKVVSWFVGGLNFQVFHHLFHKISHIHYPALQKIAKEVFGTFGFTYNQYPTMWCAIKAHFIHLNSLGKRPTI